MKTVFLILLIAGAVYLIYTYAMPMISGPEFENTNTDSIRLRQQEAREMLRNAQLKQNSHHNRFGKFTWILDSLDVPERGTYYKMKMTEVMSTYFSIRAEGNVDNDKTLDVWVIMNDGQPRNLIDDAFK